MKVWGKISMHSSEIIWRSVVNFEFTRYMCRCKYKRARTTNGEIGPVTKFGIVLFTLYEYLEERSDIYEVFIVYNSFE